MKKILVTFLLVGMLFTLCGCDDVSFQEPVKVSNETDTSLNTGSMFAVVEKGQYWWVIYHKETKVMYLMSAGMDNSGTFEVMVNAEGKPMLYESQK